MGPSRGSGFIRWEGGGDTSLKLAECSRYGEEVYEEGRREVLCVGSRVVFLYGQNRQKNRDRAQMFSFFQGLSG